MWLSHFIYRELSHNLRSSYEMNISSMTLQASLGPVREPAYLADKYLIEGMFVTGW